MTIVGLGKITVTTSGTPVALSATKLMVRRVIFTFDPADTSATVFVKDSAGIVVAALVTGSPGISVGGDSGSNLVDLSTLKVDAGSNSKGPYVGYEVA